MQNLPKTDGGDSGRDVANAHVYHLAPRAYLAKFAAEGCIQPPSLGEQGDSVWSKEFQSSRSKFRVPFPSGACLDSFVPFNFSSRTPAAYRLATGHNVDRVFNRDLVIFRTTAHRLLEALLALVVVDQMPLSRGATFHAGIDKMRSFDWTLFKSTDFRNTPSDPARTSKLGAELLVYGSVPASAIETIICWNSASDIEEAFPELGGIVRVEQDRFLFFHQGG